MQTASPTSTLLGDRSPAEFLDTYWQKRPLVVRDAMPAFESPLSPEELAGLACEPDLIVADAETCEPVPKDGETMGEVLFRGNVVMRGYLKNKPTTDKAFKGGWYHSGDLGVMDGDGYLTINGRLKDMIIRGGENISCIEVEDAIYAHEDVAECSVFGIPDDRFGEVPAAVFRIKQGREPMSPEALREFLLSRIAPFKVPLAEHVWVADESLPRLGTQKIDKRTVREMFAAERVAA